MNFEFYVYFQPVTGFVKYHKYPMTLWNYLVQFYDNNLVIKQLGGKYVFGIFYWISFLQVLDRGEKIELLVDKTQNLHQQVSDFVFFFPSLVNISVGYPHKFKHVVTSMKHVVSIDGMWGLRLGNATEQRGWCLPRFPFCSVLFGLKLAWCLPIYSSLVISVLLYIVWAFMMYRNRIAS